jgi:hypothetical protein
MNLIRYAPRFAALAFAVVVAANCDSRLPTQSGTNALDDVDRPVVKFALSAGVNNTVDIGTPLTVSVTGTDNVGVSYMFTRVSNGAQVLGIDTVTIKPSQGTVTRNVPVKLGGLTTGDKITIRATVSDGATNEKTDSLVVTVADSAGPSLTVSSSKASRPVTGGDTLDILVSAHDSSGVAYAGYRLLRIRTTDSVLIKADSSFVPVGAKLTSFQTPAYSYVVPDTLLTGNYTIVGFALDRSGVYTKAGKPGLPFSIVDGQKPSLTFLAPVAGAKLNVGDSMLVTVRLEDNIALQKVSFEGISVRTPTAGIDQIITRYPMVSAPSATFRPGLRDTSVQRFLRVQAPVDTVTDTLVVTGVLTDLAGNADTVRVKVKMVNGPTVVFLSPVLGDSATNGANLAVSLKALSTLGVTRLGFRATTDPSWPTPIDTTVIVNYSSPLKTAQMQAAVKVPANAPLKGVITITPISTDINGQDGSSTPALVAVRAGTAPAPKVMQTLATRIETKDTLYVIATGSNMARVGFEAIDDATGALIKRDSMTVNDAMPFPYAVPLDFSPLVQGKKVRIRSFAYDGGGRLGYSVRSTSVAGTTFVPAVDTALVVYGRTYTLPVNRNGAIADLVVDRTRGNVFLSNINYGRLEVWQKATQSFDGTGVVVGSQPWGMTVSRTAAAGDTLYVANSGGTNLSRVFIGSATASGMKEDLNNRLLTRVSFMFKLTEVRDPATGKIRITVSDPISYSDRPQYVEQSSSGRLYFSTKPTSAAPLGTVRYLDPAASAPDQRFILAFAKSGSDPNSFLVANIDAASVIPASATSTANDELTLCDHASGTTASATCVTSTLGIVDAINNLKAAVPQSDVEYGANLDETSIGLSDTTFATSSGDGKWIAFGEGNTGSYGRALMLRDDGTVPGRYTFASPAINVGDLIKNAADKVFGIALDKTGKTVGIHGSESYFAAVEEPFNLRLQGKKSTFDKGAGITFHPNADGISTPQAERLSFVASANGSIEMIDIAYYDFQRGALATKFNLYGPLRASLPFPGDDPSVVFKLFGVSSAGLVVIDVTASDILPGP